MNTITRFGCVVAVSATLVLVGCQTPGTGQTVGTLGGAAAGAAIGSQMGSGRGRLAAMVIGAIIGAIAGNIIGRKLDEEERRRANAAANAALHRPVGTTSSWSSRRGNHGSMRVTRAAVPDAKGRPCKVLTHNITWSDGKKSEQVVTYCQSADGSWETVT